MSTGWSMLSAISVVSKRSRRTSSGGARRHLLVYCWIGGTGHRGHVKGDGAHTPSKHVQAHSPTLFYPPSEGRALISTRLLSLKMAG